SLLAGNFPVIRATLADPDWHALVRAFYSGHRCQTPLFTEIGREFVRWLDARQSADPALPPWLAELAHYEWVELALQISDAEPGADVARVRSDRPDAKEVLLGGVPVVSPHAWARAYRLPGLRLCPCSLPTCATVSPCLWRMHPD